MALLHVHLEVGGGELLLFLAEVLALSMDLNGAAPHILQRLVARTLLHSEAQVRRVTLAAGFGLCCREVILQRHLVAIVLHDVLFAIAAAGVALNIRHAG